MPPLLAGAGIGAIGQIGSALIGSNAATKAAQQQQQAEEQALAYEKQNAGQATGYINQQLGATQQEQQPYYQSGTGALANLNYLLGNGNTGSYSTGNGGTAPLSSLVNPSLGSAGSLLQGYGQFQAPTAAQAEAQPGYQFQLQQGENALQNSAAARGTLLSGGTAAGIEQYGQQAATQDYSNVYNQMLGTYQQNYNTFANNQANEYNRLAGLAAGGQGAANELAGAQQGAAGQTANVLMGSAGQVGQTLGNIGAAQASGTVGSANAWSGALGNVSNLASNAGTLAALPYLQNGGNSGWGASGSYSSSY